MSIWEKKPEDGQSDFLAPRPAVDDSIIRSHSLAEVAVDAGSIDVSPSTSSIEIVAEEPRFTREVEVADPNATRRSNYSRRDSLRGEAFDQPEPAAMLTADRLLDASARNRPAPEAGFRRFLYFLSLKTINLGDPLAVRERKAVDLRIGAPLEGGARFVPVLTRKGGVRRPLSVPFWEWHWHFHARTASLQLMPTLTAVLWLSALANQPDLLFAMW